MLFHWQNINKKWEVGYFQKDTEYVNEKSQSAAKHDCKQLYCSTIMSVQLKILLVKLLRTKKRPDIKAQWKL